MLTIIKAYPPNIAVIRAAFDIAHRANVVFTYGDTLYNPSGGDIPDDLMVHEWVHSRQQNVCGAAVWWERYLTDRDFREAQEVEAYAAQFDHARQNYARPARRALLARISADLSSGMYRLGLSRERARFLIMQAAEVARC